MPPFIKICLILHIIYDKYKKSNSINGEKPNIHKVYYNNEIAFMRIVYQKNSDVDVYT